MLQTVDLFAWGVFLLCCCFGNALQPISILAWFHLPMHLVLFDTLASMDHLSPILQLMVPILVPVSLQFLGFAVAFGGAFGFPHISVVSVLIAAGIGGILALVTTFLVVIPFTCLRKRCFDPARYPAVSQPIALAVLFAACQALLRRFGNSVFLAASAVADTPLVVHLTAIAGELAIDFTLGLFAAAVHSYWLQSICEETNGVRSPNTSSGDDVSADEAYRQRAVHMRRIAGPSSAKRHGHSTMAGVALVVLLLTAGGVTSFWGYFGRIALPSEVTSEVPVSCVVSESLRPGTPEWDQLWAHTEDRIAAGDAIVLWSEEAVAVESREEERSLLKRAMGAVTTRGSTSSTTYLGITYEFHNDTSDHGKGSGANTNHFVLLSSDGTVEWDYLKAHPVPFVESVIRRGPATLPTLDTAYGRLGGAICLDLDYPDYIRQAGRAGVDVLLQPSWTWGQMGPRLWQGESLRAVENGFTLFRCSSNGVSGIVSPRGTIVQQLTTGSEGLHLMTLPLQPHRRTAYVAGGHVLKWLVLVPAVMLWLCALVFRVGTADEDGTHLWGIWLPIKTVRADDVRREQEWAEGSDVRRGLLAAPVGADATV